jgi:DNA-binding NarL/FixJ family response regulator
MTGALRQRMPMNLPLFLVEDKPRIRDQLIALVQMSLNAQIVGLAETEQDAVLWLHSHKGVWKIAVIDLFLKEGTGFGILSHLHNCRSGKVVVLTNSATAENRARCLRLGADAVFDKSSELENFIDYCFNMEY